MVDHFTKELHRSYVESKMTELTGYVQKHQDTKDMTGADWIRWAETETQEYNQLYIAEKLKEGAGRKVIFSPFLGEWGHRCQYHIRMVHWNQAAEKIVCLPKGQGLEALYPSAHEFFYNWTDPLQDHEKLGTDRWFRAWPEIQAKFPDHHLAQSGNLSMAQEWYLVRPTESIPFKFKKRGLKVDVILTTRNRQFLPEKNWPYVQLIADACIERGLTFATLGKEPIATHLKGESYFSGDFEDIDAGLELISNAKFFFGPDSGACHLAAAVGINMAVLDIPDDIAGRTSKIQRTFVDLMEQINFDHKTHKINKAMWFEPERVVELVTSMLPEPEKKPVAIEIVQPKKRGRKKTAKAAN